MVTATSTWYWSAPTTTGTTERAEPGVVRERRPHALRDARRGGVADAPGDGRSWRSDGRWTAGSGDRQSSHQPPVQSDAAANNLPEVVGRLAEADGQPRPAVQMVAVGGFSLEDHWNQGDAQRAIANDRWNVVVLQQGPSALPESRRLLVEDARRFGEVIRKDGRQTGRSTSVWPYHAIRRQDFARTPASRIARPRKPWTASSCPPAMPGASCCSDTASSRCIRTTGLRPTPAGTYLAALVIYQGL